MISALPLRQIDMILDEWRLANDQERDLKPGKLYRLGQGDVIILNVHGWNRCMFVKLLIPPKVC